MLSFDDLKSIISILEKQRISYYVFGGIAIDGLRGAMTREHSDLDLFIVYEDLKKFFNLMKPLGYSCTKVRNMYFLYHDAIKVGVIVLSKEKGEYIVNGNKTREIYPSKIFAKEDHGVIGGIGFRIAPIEVLAFESQYSDHPGDRKLARGLSYDKSLFKQIKHIMLQPNNDDP